MTNQTLRDDNDNLGVLRGARAIADFLKMDERAVRHMVEKGELDKICGR
jgi:hypothetical protein